jgi:hypothetical protein
MPLDPSIILGAKPIQIDMAQFSPINTLTTAMKFKQADQESRMNALKMQEYERAREEEEGTRNYLTQADLSTPEGRMGLRKFGKTGLAYEKSLSDTETAALAQKKAKFEVQDARKKFVAQAARDTSQNPSDANITAYKEDLMANDLFTDAEKAQMAAAADRILAMPADQRSAFMASQGASASELKPTTTVIDQSGQRQLVQTTPFTGAVKTLGTYADVPLPAAVQAQKMQVAEKGAPKVSYGPQEKAFEGELGKGQAKRIIDSQVAAQDAAAIIDTVKTGRDIMKSGMITGAGADFLVNFNQALKTAGIDAGFADAAANSQAFAANMAGNVGRLIKQFGAGTGLSDADREFATAMAGGKIAVDAKAISRILDINEKAARNTITRHNKDVEGIKTNIPLKVEMPPEVKSAPGITPPPSAIDYLRANPSMKGAFDAKYGAGAADRALKGR